MTKTYTLEFLGYFQLSQIKKLANCPGIYGVYVCENGKIKELIYIGRAKDIGHRFTSGHHDLSDWQDDLVDDEELRFNVASVEGKLDRKRVEAAMIYKHKPDCNDYGKDDFDYPETTIETLGKNSKMRKEFTVPCS